MLGMP